MDLERVQDKDNSRPIIEIDISGGDNEVDEEPQEIEIVHKLQRAAQYASRKKLQEQQEAISTRENNQSHAVVADALEQRSQIAIIQMAPPAQGSSTRSSKPNEAPSATPSSSKGNRGKQGASGAIKKKQRHQCSVLGCTYNTPHTKDLARHMRKHTGEKPYNCDRCSKSFTRYDKLVLHIRIHEGYRPYSCQMCDHTATDSSGLKKHMRTHTNERPYKCQLCPYASKDSSQLVVHIRGHTGDSPYTCTFNDCDAAFRTPSDLTRHTRLHTGEKPYKCSYCDYRAAVKCNLNAHVKRHTNPAKKKGKARTVVHVNVEEEESSRDDETETFESDNVLPFQYACKLCEFRADSIDLFGLHMKESHPDSNTGASSRNERIEGKSKTSSKSNSFFEQRNFQCTNCRAAFVCEESLRCHMRQHTTVPNKPANVAPEIYTPSRMRVVQSSNNTNVQNSNFTVVNSVSTNDYTLHEMQRVPPVQSVITENPAVIGNVPFTHSQPHHQVQFEDISTHQNNMYLNNYCTTYRNHVGYHQ